VRKQLLMLNSATRFWLSQSRCSFENGCHRHEIFENSAKLFVMSGLSEKVEKSSFLSGDSITFHYFVVATREDFSLKILKLFELRIVTFP
jgi:hypothetical protein